MNADGRKEIAEWVKVLESMKEDITVLGEEECEKFENLSEGLQQAEKGQAMEAAGDSLSSAADSIDEAIGHLAEIE